MSAGKGITHSEYNPSKSTDNHFLQVWIQPSQGGLQPRYQQRRVEAGAKRDRLHLIATSGTEGTAVQIKQDARVYATQLGPQKQIKHIVERSRHVWLHVATGQLTVNGTMLKAGDAIATSRPTSLQIEGVQQAEALLFDLG